MKFIKFIKSIFSDIISSVFGPTIIWVTCMAILFGICWVIGWFSHLFDVVILSPRTGEPAYMLVGLIALIFIMFAFVVIILIASAIDYLKTKWKEIE